MNESEFILILQWPSAKAFLWEDPSADTALVNSNQCANGTCLTNKELLSTPCSPLSKIYCSNKAILTRECN